MSSSSDVAASRSPATGEAVRCAHCALPVPAGLVQGPGRPSFCCQGCRAVFEVIHGSGLEDFYRIRAQDSWSAAPARPTGRRYAEFDDPTFAQLYVRPLDDRLRSIELYLEGVHCFACMWLVEQLPRLARGVIEARLDLRRSLVRVVWDSQQIELSSVAGALDTLGYPPHPARGVSARQMRRKEDRTYLWRIGLAGAAAGNVMLLAFALYSGSFSHMEAEYSRLFRWLSMLLGAGALLGPGAVFFRGAWGALRARRAHLDLPIALGLGAGGIAGVVNTVLDRGEIYFDSLTVLVFLLLVGRWIQRMQQRRAADAVELLFSLTPTAARRIEDDGVREVPLESLVAGDEVEVRAGESIPADGEVSSGESDVDLSLLTGESRPQRLGPGDTVAAGVVNLSSVLRVRVRATGAATRLGRLMQLVEESAARKAPIAQTADRIAGGFVMFVIAAATTTLLAWWASGFERAIDNAVALLIVACPCALGLATPLALAATLGRAARLGMLIKGGDALERLARTGTILLDKTGTLTEGRTRLARWVGDTSVQPLVAAVEAQSSHLVARALVEGLRDAASIAEPVQVRDVVQHTDGGIEALAGDRYIRIGSLAFAASRGVAVPGDLRAAVQSCLSEALTPVLVAVNGRAVALAGFGDPLRSDAPVAVAQLRAAGWHVGLLSGDHQQVVQRVARRLDIADADARGEVAPEQKLAMVRELAERTPIVMVGDGVNDAAALAAASVGIAVHGGAEASLAAADVYLSRPGLTPVIALIHAARRTVRLIHRNLLVSLGYNALAMSLAAGGVLTPLVAAILMPISSLSILGLTLAARPFGRKPAPPRRPGDEPRAPRAVIATASPS